MPTVCAFKTEAEKAEKMLRDAGLNAVVEVRTAGPAVEVVGDKIVFRLGKDPTRKGRVFERRRIDIEDIDAGEKAVLIHSWYYVVYPWENCYRRAGEYMLVKQTPDGPVMYRLPRRKKPRTVKEALELVETKKIEPKTGKPPTVEEVIELLERYYERHMSCVGRK